jgi:hypothetical protein
MAEKVEENARVVLLKALKRKRHMQRKIEVVQGEARLVKQKAAVHRQGREKERARRTGVSIKRHGAQDDVQQLGRRHSTTSEREYGANIRIQQEEHAWLADVASRRDVSESTKQMVAATKSVHAANGAEMLAASKLRRAKATIGKLRAELAEVSVASTASTDGVDEAMERWRRCCGNEPRSSSSTGEHPAGLPTAAEFAIFLLRKLQLLHEPIDGSGSRGGSGRHGRASDGQLEPLRHAVLRLHSLEPTHPLWREPIHLPKSFERQHRTAVEGLLRLFWPSIDFGRRLKPD